MITIHKDSHIDHGIGSEVLADILKHFEDRTGSFIATVNLKDVTSLVSEVPCSLIGPATYNTPVSEEEVIYKPRPGQSYSSRLLKDGDKQATSSDVVTIICGEHDGNPCVLFTAFGGPLAPKEPGDPTLKPEEREASEKFWKEHALAVSV